MSSQFAPTPAPLDDEGFVQSYLSHETVALRSFFDEYGFVVVRDVLAPDEIERSVDDVWRYLEDETWKKFGDKCGEVDRNDHNTWTFAHGWPRSLCTEGILGELPTWTLASLQTRTNAKLYDVAAVLTGRTDLLVSHDRYALFRPTQLDHPESKQWMTSRNVHFDVNPWTYFDSSSDTKPMKSSPVEYRIGQDFIDEHNSTGQVGDGLVRIQGLVNFIDNRVEDGGFHCIPGFHRHVRAWAAQTASTIGKRFTRGQTFCAFHWESRGEVVLQDPSGVEKLAQRISVRAGSAVLWSQLLPHGSAPNKSDRPRMSQFLKYAPADSLSEETRAFRAEKVGKHVAKVGMEPTELQQCLLGLRPYNSQAPVVS